MATKKHYLVQPAKSGGFEVKARGAARASAILRTQAEAEDKAKELNPNDRANVRRVRNTGEGRPGEFRKEDE